MIPTLQRSALTLVVSATLWGAQGLEAQGIEARVNAVRTGTVRFTYAAGEGVCGNGANWYRSRDGRSGTFNGMWSGAVANREVETTCDRGPVRVVVQREEGDTKAIRLYVGGKWRADTGVTDLGALSAREAGGWLLSVAEHGSDKVARSALQAATVGDSIDAGAAVLRIARDDSRSQEVRSNAVHWLGELVGERVAASLDSIAYEAGDRDVRRAAIMAIARRPKDEAVPALQKLAETLPDRELRRTAVTALAQTREPAAIAWLERRLGQRD
ncbi:HEAT repeat domain-containing protein [Gemmatimonas phototrophica]|uniref:HEAT repeat domain-containing protein n=1 Tax=Gemmatimonas phototrophica TaxID=1379270 RepID=A0A143BL51_9BACT|nr:HEAT repeat domain-containing protein [Gemmatimonas phototrophica]AMW05728.1 hypothetical protein GEMMAAP_14845 [Gemmatimonas phototrophica]